MLHRGQIVYERYFGALTREKQHAVFSITKSLTGTIAASLIRKGKLDENATVGELISELSVTGAGTPESVT